MENSQIKEEQNVIRGLLKSKQRERCPSKADVHKRVDPPLPGIREVAGNVTRRSDRAVIPEPPPNNRPSANTPRKKHQPYNRSRRRIGSYDGSDSDSDHDDTRRKSDETESVIVAPHRQPAEADKLDDEFTTSLRLEEEERVRHLRDLREIGEKWEIIKQERDFNKHDGRRRREMLLSPRLAHYKRPTIPEKVLNADLYLQEYLNEVLYGAIKDTFWKSGSEDLTEREEIVQRLEMGILCRCTQYDQWKFSTKPLHERLCDTLGNAEKDSWKSKSFCDALQTARESRRRQETPALPASRHLTEVPYLSGASSAPSPSAVAESYAAGHLAWQIEHSLRWKKDISWAVQSFMQIVCAPDETKQERRFIDVLEDSFWERIVQKMSGAAISAEFSLSPDGQWLECFRTSRQKGNLTRTYVDWVLEDADPVEMEKLCVEWHWRKRQEALKSYLRSMKSVKIQVEQVFCPQIVRPHEVSLLLIKANYPTGIRSVSADELRSLGWFYDKNDTFWRCEIVNWGEVGAPTDILKVDMNGKVLGAFVLFNSDWALLEFADQERDVTPLVGPPLRIRPINRVERSVFQER